MSISFQPYVYDADRCLWLLPDAARQNPDAFELNVSNANGADLLVSLGFTPDVSYPPVAIASFAALVTHALRRRLAKRSPELDTIIDHLPGAMTVVHCGRREGYIEERLGDLAVLVQRSLAAEATHLGWG
jgi:hypothetical protein